MSRFRNTKCVREEEVRWMLQLLWGAVLPHPAKHARRSTSSPVCNINECVEITKLQVILLRQPFLRKQNGCERFNYPV